MTKAQIGWVDFSPEHREIVLQAMDHLGDEEMLDELGIGMMRDALADLLFPAISTIQTRAKYFFIVPYILWDYCKLSLTERRGKSLRNYLSDAEDETMWALGKKYDWKKGHGIIGIMLQKPNTLQTKPSSIYWHGLSTLGFIDAQGHSLSSYLRMNERAGHDTIRSPEKGDDADDIDVEFNNFLKLKVPHDAQWWEKLSIDLTPTEAKFLMDRIANSAKGKLIATLLSDDVLLDHFNTAENFAAFAQIASSSKSLGAQEKKYLILAHDFAELMYGANLAYNCQLQNKAFGNDFYAEEWTKWIGDTRNFLDFKNFSSAEVLRLTPRAKPYTKDFVIKWHEAVASGKLTTSRRDDLILDQERRNKPTKARLSRNFYDDVKAGNWIGLSRLDFRFNKAKRILNDIKEGMVTHARRQK